jgi:hypothetical protein
MKRNVRTLFAFFVVLSLAAPLGAQNQSGRGVEQSSFGGEEVPGVPFIKHPASIPESVLQILRQDEVVKSCLSDTTPTPDAPFASWFVASQIHLDGPQQADLIVLPSPRDHHPDYLCLHSVEGFSRFWIFRKTGEGYELILTTGGLGVEVAKTRHAGRRDLESVNPIAGVITIVTFCFDGKIYRKCRTQRQSQ